MDLGTQYTYDDAFNFPPEGAYTKLDKTNKLNVYPGGNSATEEAEITGLADTLNLAPNYNELVDMDDLTYNAPLAKLLSLSGTFMRQVSNNIDKSTEAGRGPRYWSTAVWNTALYDFKKRMFKCDYIHYNDETGRISEISFSEI